MLYMIFLLHLSFLPLLAIFMGLFSQTTIQLLLVVVVIVFTLGLVLLCLGNSIMGSYIIIMYMGAMVILFAFCILFINSKEATPKNLSTSQMKQNTEKIIVFIFMIILWEIFASFGSEKVFKAELNSSFGVMTEANYMLPFAEHLFSHLIMPLLLMMLILLLGLVLTMSIMSNKE